MLNQNLIARGECHMPTLRPVLLSQTDHERLSVFLHWGKANCRGARTK